MLGDEVERILDVFLIIQTLLVVDIESRITTETKPVATRVLDAAVGTHARVLECTWRLVLVI